jgi:Rrf2 family transcriptional regulator, iron-sulfur cluster assembly transcription factor
MIYSRSSEYAIRALVHLAHAPEGKFTMARQIAEEEGIPAFFLAKILQQLARKKMLLSSKGPTGGFSIRGSSGDLRLIDVVESLDGSSHHQHCPAGLAECSDTQVCPMHDSWIGLRSRIMDYLERNTISDLAMALDHKRRTLEKSRRGKRAMAARR